MGDKEAIQVLEKDFANDEVFKAKAKHLAESYGHLRRTRPDGNCFYRAFLMAVAEKARQDQEFRHKFDKAIAPTKGNTSITSSGLED